MNVEPEQALFAGERVLWTGRPQRARRSVQEVGLALYLVIGVPGVLVLMAVQFFRHPQPSWFIAFAAIIVVGGISQTIGYLIHLLVIGPRTRASVTYAVTDRRVTTTAGQRKRVTSSTYISVLPKPEIVRHGDGTSTLRFGRAPMAKRSTPIRSTPIRSTPIRTPLRRAAPALELSALSAADAAAALAAVQQARNTPSGGEASAASSFTASATALPIAVPPGWKPASGEQVLWVGRPGRARWWYGGYDVYTSLFGVAWTATAVIMEALAISSRVWPVAAVVLVFVGLGVHMVAGRLVWRRARIRRSTYLVTTRRVATVWNLRRPRVVSASLADLRPPALSDDGTLTFALAAPSMRQQSRQSPASMLSPAATGEPPVFLDLADAATVYRIIGAAQAGVAEAAAPSV